MNSTPHHVLQLLIALFVWTIVLLSIIKIYGDNYFHHSDKIQQPIKLRENEEITRSGIPQNPADTLLLFDKNKAPNQSAIIAAIESEHPSLAFRYWYNHKRKRLQKSKKCAKFPTVLQLKYHNKYWQTFTMPGVIMQLYNAYYDRRPALPKGAPIVRLLAMSNETVFRNHSIYCQLWYNDSLQPSFSKATDFRSIWNLKWGKTKGQLYPHLISCPLPRTGKRVRVPQVVALVAKECDTATNSLRIHYDALESGNSTKQRFAICVKGLDYPYADISARLVEWLELQFVLGASKIFFYELQLHPNVVRVLEHYKQRGLVDIRPITLAGGEPSLTNLQHFLLGGQRFKKRLNELIPYNDCFYRNIYRYDFIAVQDIDEVIMPLGNRTKWADLMDYVPRVSPKKCRSGYASYCFRNVYFSHGPNSTQPYAPDIPPFMHMLQHVERNRTHMRAGVNVKCFHSTDRAITLHNHFSRSWLKGCSWKTFDAKIAQLQHYRERPRLKHIVIDKSIWRYKDQLLQRSLEALRDIGFLPKV